MLTWRQIVARYLDDIDSVMGLTINFTIVGLILLSMGMFVTETYDISMEIRRWLSRIDLGILGIFSVEYMLRLWCSDAKLKFIFSLYSLIDLLAILPLFFGLIDIRFIRIFRWFRLLRLFRFFEFEVSIFHIRSGDGIILARILLILFAIVFIYSGLIYQVEHPTNPETFSNFFDAFYFSIVTMTTVGFGDLIPLSDLGRALTLLMILTGILFIPWQVGDLIKQLVKNTTQVRLTCASCDLSFHDLDAIFCKRCGDRLPRNQTETCDEKILESNAEQRMN